MEKIVRCQALHRMSAEEFYSFEQDLMNVLNKHKIAEFSNLSISILLETIEYCINEIPITIGLFNELNEKFSCYAEKQIIAE